MLREDLEHVLDWILEWLENREHKERIKHLIAEILEDMEEIRRDDL